MAKAKTKTKSAAVPAAQTRDEAERLVARIGQIQRELDRREADLGDMVAKLKAEAEKAAQVLRDEQAAAHRAVQGWAEANRQDLTRGRTKTVELATGKVLWRSRPPSVRVTGAKAVLHWLMFSAPGGEGFGAFVRIKSSIDKEAMKAHPELAAKVPGVKVGSAGEVFVVEPFEAKLIQADTAEPAEVLA